MTAALRRRGRRALAQLAALGYEPDRIVLDGKHDYLALGARVTTVIKAMPRRCRWRRRRVSPR